MFQSIRQDSLVYIFHGGDNPYAETGTVSAPPVVKPKYSIPQAFGQQEMVVTITVNAKGGSYTFKDLPSCCDTADVYMGSECVTVMDSREAFNAKILSIKKKTEDTIESIPKLKDIVVRCDSILREFNPEFAEKQAQQDKIDMLEKRMSDMSESMERLMESNKLLIDRLSQKE